VLARKFCALEHYVRHNAKYEQLPRGVRRGG
jgi:hypothetical protein